MRKSIQIFEYQSLPIGSNGFLQNHFDRLVRFNELHGCKYFDIGHKKIRFKSFVGVIQVGSLVIEILPKADADQSPEKAKWQSALIRMLQRSRMLKLESLSKATLKLRPSTLLDLYIESFLVEVQRLCHERLLRRYRKKQGNVTFLKGKLIFSKQVCHNYIHKERFYTEHTLFDRNNIFNRIIKSALLTIFHTSSNVRLVAEANSLLINFEDVKTITVPANTFKRLHFDRNTERYRYPIQLAKLILLQYMPDVRGGQEHVLAILFDMNVLFEKYVYAELKRAESKFPELRLKISAQHSRRFWGTQKLRPDILADFTYKGEEKRMIMDTKWKTLISPKPSDNDLRQMFAYNLQFGANEAVLLYPKVKFGDPVTNDFAFSQIPLHFEHGCGLYFVQLFGENKKLRSDIGMQIINSLILEK